MSALLRHAAIAPVVWLVAAVGPAQELSRRAGAINDVANVFLVLFLGLFVVIGMSILGSGLHHSDGFFTILGSAAGGGALFVSVFFGRWSFLVLLLVGSTALLIGYLKGQPPVRRLKGGGCFSRR
jgi:hypothetical protein